MTDRQTDRQTDRIAIANTRSQQYLPVQLSRVKNVEKILKNVKKRKKRDLNKKRKKTFITSMLYTRLIQTTQRLQATTQSHGQPLKQERGFSAVHSDIGDASPDLLHQFYGLMTPRACCLLLLLLLLMCLGSQL